MSNIVVWFAETVLGDDRGRALIDTDQFLGAIEYEDHRVGVQNVIGLAQQVDTVETIDRIEDIIRWTIYDRLVQYGIRENVTAPIAHQLRLLRSLYDIEDYNEPQTMLHDLEDVGSAEERYCYALMLLYGGTVEDYIDDIESVDPDLLERIQSRLIEQQRHIEAQLPPELQQARDLGTYSDFRMFYHIHGPERITRLLDEGWQLGYTFTDYFEALVDFDTDDRETIAMQYAVAALASGDTFHQARDHASARLEPYYNEDNARTLQLTLQRIRELIEESAYEQT